MSDLLLRALELADGWEWLPPPASNGTEQVPMPANQQVGMLSVQAAAQGPWWERPLGQIPGQLRWVCLSRFSPFWLRPHYGPSLDTLPAETQWCLVERRDGSFLLLVPLIGGHTRFALAARDGVLTVAADTADTVMPAEGGVALLAAVGTDPYALCTTAAAHIRQHHGGGACRGQRPRPAYLQGLGWCTWDAFYKAVSPQGVLDGLRSLRQAGVPVGFLILDDGWQQRAAGQAGEEALTGLGAHQGFGGSLAALVQQAKSVHGVRQVLVWHALLGYWGGLDAQAFPDWGVRTVAKSFSPGLLAQDSRWNVWPWGAHIGVPDAAALPAYFEALHGSLGAQGVDGVKVDAQGLLEGVSQGQGGRVNLGRAMRQALQQSVDRHFGGTVVHCMACTPETWQLSPSTAVLRTSDDFFPQRPDSHAGHLLANAMASLWLGEFFTPDWDMFHSVHPWAGFHAAARAISGGPVYVSDPPGQHDGALLRLLVLSDGTVPLPDGPAKPSPCSLMEDPLHSLQGLKVFNRNGPRAVVGLFGVHAQGACVPMHADPADVPGLPPGAYAAWSHRQAQVYAPAAHAAPAMPAQSMAPGDWDLVCLAPVEHGFAAFGLVSVLNMGATVQSITWHSPSACSIQLRDGGSFMAWAERTPRSAQCGVQALAFEHRPDGTLEVQLPPGQDATGGRCLRLEWGPA